MFNYINLGCIMILVAAPLIEMLLMTLNNLVISFKDVYEFPSRMSGESTLISWRN